MATFLEGDQLAGSHRFAVAVARFNADITEPLLDGALHAFRAAGVADDAVDVARVPGAFELPVACEKLAATGKYSAVIALGCVLRGDTPHFDYVCAETSRGVMDVGLRHQLPAILGVLTCDTLAQAQLRASRTVLESSDRVEAGRSEKHSLESNKGSEAADAALEMAGLMEKIR